jgi:mono/diheme cytochrome c family protein
MCENFLVAMDTNPKRNPKISKIFFALTLLLICITLVYATYEGNKAWVVPEEARVRKNPLPPSPAALQAARPIYREYCVQCHGDAGKGDGPEAMMQYPAPADLTDSSRMSTVTDGEIFYQISVGKRPMPSFKSRLTEEQRWQLVLLVRSFAQSAAHTNPADKKQP